ncbi:MAG: hypothetical protein HQL70_11555 [Magnetococcales bacterium]|nr:hypothetical protein [Magnetococcales bacterium]
MIEILLSFGILFLIILVGWRLYSEVSQPDVPMLSSTKQPAPVLQPKTEPQVTSVYVQPKIQKYVQSTNPPAQPPSTQISVDEYKRIIELERQVITLAVNQAEQSKQLKRVINLERDVAAISANHSGEDDSSDRLADLERGIANFAALQSVQKENSNRLAELERGIATISATQAVQTQRSSRFAGMQRELATLSAQQKVQNDYGKRLTAISRRVSYVEQLVQLNSKPRNIAAPINSSQSNSQQQQKERFVVPVSRATNSSNVSKRGYFIPAGCFIYRNYADRLEQRISKWGLPLYRKNIASKGRYFNCIFVGPILERLEAEKTLQTLQSNSIAKAVTVIAYK